MNDIVDYYIDEAGIDCSLYINHFYDGGGLVALIQTNKTLGERFVWATSNIGGLLDKMNLTAAILTHEDNYTVVAFRRDDLDDELTITGSCDHFSEVHDGSSVMYVSIGDKVFRSGLRCSEEQISRYCGLVASEGSQWPLSVPSYVRSTSFRKSFDEVKPVWWISALDMGIVVSPEDMMEMRLRE